jgi:hypothetical protein
MKENKEIITITDMKLWNKAVKEKKLYGVPYTLPKDKQGKGCMMIYQFCSGIIQWRDKLWRVTGWSPPKGKPFVEITSIQLENSNDRV